MSGSANDTADSAIYPPPNAVKRETSDVPPSPLKPPKSLSVEFEDDVGVHPTRQLFQSVIDDTLTFSSMRPRSEKSMRGIHLQTDDMSSVSVVESPQSASVNGDKTHLKDAPRKRGAAHREGLRAMMKANREKNRKQNKLPDSPMEITLTVQPGMRLSELIPDVRHESVDKVYSIKKELGKGNFGKVYLAFSRNSHKYEAFKEPLKRTDSNEGEDSTEAVAVKKIVKMNPANVGAVAREVSVMQTLKGHSGLVQLLGVYEDDTSIYLALELVTGGDLCAAIATRLEYTEGHVQALHYQLVTALAFMHDHRVLHLDLKPENIMCMNAHNQSADMILKITDFGVSKVIGEGETISQLVGTPLFSAPEVHRGEQYSFGADIWSLGAILYVLLVGQGPYDLVSRAELKDYMSAGRIAYEGNAWQPLSEHAIDMVKVMLEPAVDKRIQSAKQCLEHPFLTKTHSSGEEYPVIHTPRDEDDVDVDGSDERRHSATFVTSSGDKGANLQKTQNNMGSYWRRRRSIQSQVKQVLKSSNMSIVKGLRSVKSLSARNLKGAGPLQSLDSIKDCGEEEEEDDDVVELPGVTVVHDPSTSEPASPIHPHAGGSERMDDARSTGGSSDTTPPKSRGYRIVDRGYGSFHISEDDAEGTAMFDRMMGGVVLDMQDSTVLYSHEDPNIAKLKKAAARAYEESAHFDINSPPIGGPCCPTAGWEVTQHFSVRELNSMVPNAEEEEARNRRPSYYVYEDDISHIPQPAAEEE